MHLGIFVNKTKAKYSKFSKVVLNKAFFSVHLLKFVSIRSINMAALVDFRNSCKLGVGFLPENRHFDFDFSEKCHLNS